MAPAAQLAMFPRRALIEFPKAKPTADALGEVDADDGHRYFVKADSVGTPIRASEWISTGIAEAVGVTTPSMAPIEMIDGRVVFGSRKISGVASEIVTQAYLLSPSASNVGNPPAVGLRAILSAIYALDMFLFNDDRHVNNYLSVDDSGTRRLYAFDFSRALFWRWPWMGFPPLGCNTRTVGAVLRQLHGFDMVVAGGVLDRVAALSPQALEGVVNAMPPEWLSAPLRADLVSWWSRAERGVRVNELRKGLIDGSLL